MEESANRKARLKAMRTEAAEAEASHSVGTSTVSTHLSNPLADPSPNASLQENSPVSARFGFYTDPMAAFSGDRRKSQKIYQNSPNNFSPPNGPGNMNMPPSPCQQYNQSHSSDQRMCEAAAPYQNSGSWRSSVPQQHATPAVWNGPGGTAGYSFPPNSPIRGGFPPNSPAVPGFPPNSPTVHGFSSPYFGRGGSPSPSSGSSDRHQFSNTPNPSFGRGGTPNPNFGRGTGYSNTPNPNFGQVGTPNPSAGRGSRFNSSPSTGFGGSPSPNTGRSSGHQFNNSPSPSPGSGRGRGRGRGRGKDPTARERPDVFYNRSMLEDPWRLLTPVVRKITSEEESSNTPRPWLPKSIYRNKDKNPEVVAAYKPSGVSLAESLAASFEEAAALAASYEQAAAEEANAACDVKDI